MDKSKNTRFDLNRLHITPVYLWKRDYPDSAGYEEVTMYVDPGEDNLFDVRVVYRWNLHTDHVYSRMEESAGYTSIDEAQQAGVRIYQQRKNRVAETKAAHRQALRDLGIREYGAGLLAFLLIGGLVFGVLVKGLSMPSNDALIYAAAASSLCMLAVSYLMLTEDPR